MEISLDELTVLDSTKPDFAPVVEKLKKKTKYEQQRDIEYARSMAIAESARRYFLTMYCEHYTLEEVIEFWWKAQMRKR